VLGIVAGWLYERCRSLWPCILLHAAYNGFVTGYYDWILSHPEAQTTGFGVAFTGASFGALIVGGLILLKLLGGKRAKSVASER